MSASVPFDVYKWFCDNRRQVSSWAVWENPPTALDPARGLTTQAVGEVGFFAVDGEEGYLLGVGRALRRDVVLVGLNPAGRDDGSGNAIRDERLFGCFHDSDTRKVKDHRLRAIAYHWGLWGALVVDLDTITVETDSKVALAKLLDQDQLEHRVACAKQLDEALNHLAPLPGASLVFLGGDVERCARLPEFKEVFAKHFTEPAKTIWHYSHLGGLEGRIRNATRVLGEPRNPSGLWVPGRTDQP